MNSQKPPCLEAALHYLDKGWSAIPLCPPDHEGVSGEHQQSCKAPGKAPIAAWKQYQVQPAKEAVLRLYWTKTPTCNVGLVMGMVSGLIGIDMDGQEGQDLMVSLVKPHDLPKTLEFTTPGGGRRLLFKHPIESIPIKSIKDSNGHEAIRILGHGSQTVAPPSIHASGGQYKWIEGHGPDDTPAADLPEWLLDKLKALYVQQVAGPPIALPATPETDIVARAIQYLNKCDPAISTQGGHNQTYKIAVKLVKGFALDPDVAFNLLATYYNYKCVPPWSAKELQHKVDEATKAKQPTGFLLNEPNPTPILSEPDHIHTRNFTNIEQRPVEWLWNKWIPLGKLTILDGDPGLGKSTLLLDIVARVTTNGLMPDGTMGITGNVIVMSAEDAPEDTIKPRLVAAGANLERVTELSHIVIHNQERPVEIPSDIPQIAQIIKETHASLLIIDPLMAFLYGADANKDQEIRRVLYKLSKVAEKYKCAIIVMRHLNKSGGGKAIYRGNSSIGVIGHARTGLIVAADPEDEETRILAVSKCNLSAKPKSLKFALQQIGEVCKIQWGGACGYKADELVNQPDSPEDKEDKVEAQTKVNKAAELIETLLADGPKQVKVIKKNLADAGYSHRTTERAAKKLGLTLTMMKNPDAPTDNIYHWNLPNYVGEVAEPQPLLAA